MIDKTSPRTASSLLTSAPRDIVTCLPSTRLPSTRRTALQPVVRDADGWLPMPPFRAHFQALVEASGLSWRVVALAAGLPVPLARRLVAQPSRRREQIRTTDAQRLFALSPTCLDQLCTRLRPAGPAWCAMAQLLAIGLGIDEVARRSGLEIQLVEQLAACTIERIPALEELRVKALRDELLADPTSPRLGHMPHSMSRAA